MASQNPILTAHNEYATRWSATATAFQQQGAYDWMAAQVMGHQPSKILDVGCGMGNGLAALLARDARLDLVSIDEVTGCLQQTETRLQQAGFQVERIDRLRFPVTNGIEHRIKVTGAIPTRLQPITLVQGNAATPDDDLLRFLEQQAPFDTMTVWLIGAHLLRLHCEDALKRSIRSPEAYRLMVQNRAYELANRLLRPGGVLNLVDREGQSNDPAIAQAEDRERREAHAMQAEGTTLAVIDVQSMPYQEADGGGAMVYSPGTSGRVPAGFHMRLFSVTSQKR